MSEDTGRISVSRDALRAELAQMELRLLEKLATRSEHDELERRVTTLEHDGNADARRLAKDVVMQDERIDRVERLQARLAGGLGIVGIIAGTAVPMLARHYGLV